MCYLTKSKCEKNQNASNAIMNDGEGMKQSKSVGGYYCFQENEIIVSITKQMCTKPPMRHQRLQFLVSVINESSDRDI